MVMIDRMFNQEERQCLSRDKRLAIVDPGKKFIIIISTLNLAYRWF